MQYQFQFWANNSSDQFNYQITASAGNSVMLGSNADRVEGGLGQWVIGNFTADSATQSITFLGDGDGGFLNGFQLREAPIGPSVPDSGSTFALLGCACAALVVVRRRRSRADAASS
jgi:hypothetical protein